MRRFLAWAKSLFSLLQGALVLAGVLGVFAIALYRGQSDTAARTLAFSTLVFGMLALITVNRSRSANVFQALRSPNRAYWWVVASALGFLAAVIYIPALTAAFRFTMLYPNDLGDSAPARRLRDYC